MMKENRPARSTSKDHKLTRAIAGLSTAPLKGFDQTKNHLNKYLSLNFCEVFTKKLPFPIILFVFSLNLHFL